MQPGFPAGGDLVRVGGAGQLEAECAGRVGEPALVCRSKVEHLGALGQQVEHVAVAALRLRGCGLAGLAVYAGEEVGEAAGAGSGWQDALLVVPELGHHQHGYTTLALEGAIDEEAADPLASDLLPAMLRLVDVHPGDRR